MSPALEENNYKMGLQFQCINYEMDSGQDFIYPLSTRTSNYLTGVAYQVSGGEHQFRVLSVNLWMSEFC